MRHDRLLLVRKQLRLLADANNFPAGSLLEATAHDDCFINLHAIGVGLNQEIERLPIQRFSFQDFHQRADRVRAPW